MKKIVGIGLSLLIMVFVLNYVNTFNNKTITTTEKVFKQGNYSDSDAVSYRELAIASALSYLPPPAKCPLIDECKLSDYTFPVKHINTKANLANYAEVNEMDGWNIVDYETRPTELSLVNRLFTAYTLEKGNNIIIVYRGTDFIDLFEWIQDFEGGINNINHQEGHAEEYVLRVAKKYSGTGKHIYITGHSLGGYLTQIGASTLEKAIKNGKNKTSDWDGWNLLKTYDIDEYTEDGSFEIYSDLVFEQAVYFDGIGMNVFATSKIGAESTLQNKKIEILKELASTNSSQKPNETRLIGYNVLGDVVSSLGVHYGEKREMYAPLDTISYWKRMFNTLNYNVTAAEKADSLSMLIKFGKWLIDGALYLNLTKIDVLKIYQQYDVGSNIASVVLAHKPDSFVCPLDNPDKGEVKVKVVEKQIINSVPYMGDMFTEEISKNIYTNKPVTFVATTLNACARKYVWKICDIKTGKCKNEEISDTNEYTFNEANTAKEISVTAYYDDAYQKRKIVSKVENGKTYYEYDEGETVIKNKGYKESDSIKVVYDNIAPKCSFSTANPVNINRKCLEKGFLGFCKKWNDTKTVTLKCTDDNSGFNDNNDPTFKLSNNYKALIFRIADFSNVRSIVSNDVLTINVDVQRLRNADKNPRLELKSGIKDRAGNNYVFIGQNAIYID